MRRRELHFAMLGAGFWARYQLAAWREVPGARCVALYNRTQSKAEALAGALGVPAVYDDLDELFRREQLDFVDIVTAIDTHAELTRRAARRGVDVICQKPMARTLAEAKAMVGSCRRAGVRFLVHENWRWQTPIRQLKRELDSEKIGRPFRARIELISGFPVFVNQPFLRELDRFILADLGTHLLDVARFLFGEADRVYCRTQRVHPDIRGEDVATVVLRMGTATVVVSMAYAENYLEHDCFPETVCFVEGDRGSIELGPHYWLRVTGRGGTRARRHPPPRYPWADPAYDVVQASIVPCHANLLAALQGRGRAETTGADNLRTLRLVFGAYQSAATGKEIKL